MSALDDPGRGGVAAEIGGTRVTLRLTLGEIERYEDKHERGIYGLFQSCLDDARPPRYSEVRDLISLAVVGGGKTPEEAAELMRREGPERMLRHRTLAQELMIATLVPAQEDRDLLETEEAGDEKKSDPGSGSGN